MRREREKTRGSRSRKKVGEQKKYQGGVEQVSRPCMSERGGVEQVSKPYVGSVEQMSKLYVRKRKR